MPKIKKAIIEEQSDADKEMKNAIGKKIQKVRKRLGHTALWVAGKLGVQRASISQIETGTVHVNAVTLCKLAFVFGCNVQDFFPQVPNASSLEDKDIEELKRENEQAADFFKKAFKIKK